MPCPLEFLPITPFSFNCYEEKPILVEGYIDIPNEALYEVRPDYPGKYNPFPGKSQLVDIYVYIFSILVSRIKNSVCHSQTNW